MSTSYDSERFARLGKTLAPLAPLAPRAISSDYGSSASLLAAIRAALAVAPENAPRHSDPFAFADTAHEVRIWGTTRSGGYVYGEGPTIPPWSPPAYTRVSFTYRVKGTRGRVSCANHRAAIAALLARLSSAGAVRLWDGKRRAVAFARAKTPAGSAPHITARACLDDRDFAGALAVAETVGAVYFGATLHERDAPLLNMQAQTIETHGVSFTVARCVHNGAFVVLHTDSTRNFPGAVGLRNSSAAIGWIEGRMSEDAFRDKVRTGAAKVQPFDQTAARAAFLAQQPTDPEDDREAAATSAGDAIDPADVPTAPEAAASAHRAVSAASASPSLVRSVWNDAPIDPAAAALAAACLARFGTSNPDACRHLPAFPAFAASVAAGNPEPLYESPQSAAGAPIAPADVPMVPAAAPSQGAPIAAAPRVTVRHVSADEWQARTGEVTSGNGAVMAAAATLARLCAGSPIPARLQTALDDGAKSDPGARAFIRATLAGIAGAVHLPQAADAAAALAALDSAPPAPPAPKPGRKARRTSGNPAAPSAPPTAHFQARPPTGQSGAVAAAAPLTGQSVAAPPATQSECRHPPARLYCGEGRGPNGMQPWVACCDCGAVLAGGVEADEAPTTQSEAAPPATQSDAAPFVGPSIDLHATGRASDAPTGYAFVGAHCGTRDAGLTEHAAKSLAAQQNRQPAIPGHRFTVGPCAMVRGRFEVRRYAPVASAPDTLPPATQSARARAVADAERLEALAAPLGELAPTVHGYAYAVGSVCLREQRGNTWVRIFAQQAGMRWVHRAHGFIGTPRQAERAIRAALAQAQENAKRAAPPATQSAPPPTQSDADAFIPAPITDALARVAAGDSIGSAVSWVWFRCCDAATRASVDAWLVACGHPLASEAGTAEARFRAIVAASVPPTAQSDPTSEAARHAEATSLRAAATALRERPPLPEHTAIAAHFDDVAGAMESGSVDANNLPIAPTAQSVSPWPTETREYKRAIAAAQTLRDDFQYPEAIDAAGRTLTRLNLTHIDRDGRKGAVAAGWAQCNGATVRWSATVIQTRAAILRAQRATIRARRAKARAILAERASKRAKRLARPLPTQSDAFAALLAKPARLADAPAPDTQPAPLTPGAERPAVGLSFPSHCAHCGGAWTFMHECPPVKVPPTVQPEPTPAKPDPAGAAFARITSKVTTGAALLAEAQRVADNAARMERAKSPLAESLRTLASRLVDAAGEAFAREQSPGAADAASLAIARAMRPHV